MSYDNDPNALASALPAGISYPGAKFPDETRDVWNARRIAEFQAERLAESGYRLVYVGDDEDAKFAIAQIVGVGDKDGLD